MYACDISRLCQLHSIFSADSQNQFSFWLFQRKHIHSLLQLFMISIQKSQLRPDYEQICQKHSFFSSMLFSKRKKRWWNLIIVKFFYQQLLKSLTIRRKLSTKIIVNCNKKLTMKNRIAIRFNRMSLQSWTYWFDFWVNNQINDSFKLSVWTIHCHNKKIFFTAVQVYNG